MARRCLTRSTRIIITIDFQLKFQYVLDEMKKALASLPGLFLWKTGNRPCARRLISAKKKSGDPLARASGEEIFSDL